MHRSHDVFIGVLCFVMPSSFTPVGGDPLALSPITFVYTVVMTNNKIPPEIFPNYSTCSSDDLISCIQLVADPSSVRRDPLYSLVVAIVLKLHAKVDANCTHLPYKSKQVQQGSSPWGIS